MPGVVATRDELLPFVGPPFGLPLWGALARLQYPRAALLWSFLIALSFGLLTAGAVRLIAPSAGGVRYLAALALGAGFGPLTSGMALGQVAVCACAATIAAQFALQRRNALVAAGAASIAALQPNLGIALAARLPERRALIAFALAAAVAAGCSASALGSLEGLARYLSIVREHAAAEAGIAIQTTFAAVAVAFGSDPGLAGAIALAAAVATLVALCTLFATRRYGSLERFALAGAALPLALPFAHEHDFTIALFPALACALRCSGTTWIVAAFASIGVAVDWLGLAQRPGGATQSWCLAGVAALALAALGPAELGARRFWPLALLPLVVLAGAIAAAHPAPVWPDALPPNFQAPHELSNAQVWRSEQLEAGLGKRDAVWGALRLCSLLGCAALWAAAARGLRAPGAERPR